MLYALPVVVLGLALPLPAWGADPAGPWAVTLYYGRGTDGGIEEVPGLEAEFLDAHMLAIAAARELQRFRGRAALEIEAQGAKHWDYQDHYEFNTLFLARWLAFPWDDLLDTSFAVGDGISIASQVPEIEILRSPRATSRVLNYLLFELEMRPPAVHHWSLVLRLHHRSGAFGLFNNVYRGSNVLAVGIKFHL